MFEPRLKLKPSLKFLKFGLRCYKNYILIIMVDAHRYKVHLKKS